MPDSDYYAEEEQDASSEARYRNKEKRVGYVPVSNALIRLFSDLPDAALRTYLSLCSYAFGRGETFVGQETLCQIRGAHLSTIIKHISALKDAGLISVERRGQGKTNVYIIEDIPEGALDDYIRTFIDREDEAARPRSPKSISERHEVLTSQKRKIKTSQKREVKTSRKRKTSSKVVERSIDEQQQEPSAEAGPPETPPAVVAFSSSTTNDLADRLAALGVTRATSRKLLQNHDPALVYRWVCYTEHRLSSGWVPKESPAAWLVAAIGSGDWVIPTWFQTPEEQAEAAATKKRLTQAERRDREEARTREREAAEAQRRALEDRLGIGEDTRGVWEQTRELLQARGQMTPALFSAYLLPMHNGMATVATPVQFFCEIIPRHADAVRAALEEVTGAVVAGIEVRFVAAD